MSLHYNGPTCLSPDDHADNISNHLLHYTGCIELTEREKFFTEANPVWEKEIQHQLKPSTTQEEERRIRERVNRKRQNWQRECERDFRRFALIRKCLEESEDESHLVVAVKNSLHAWRNTQEYLQGIEDVKKWSNRPHYEYPKMETLRSESYHPDKDLDVHIIRYKNREDSTMEMGPDQRGPEAEHVSHEDDWKESMDTETKKVHEIVSKAENGEPHRLNQLRDGTTKEAISYVHFPANNMKWVEEAIARYYDQDVPDYRGVLRELHRSEKTETYMILRPQYWRGLMQGSTSSLPHTRHMRPVCESISSNPRSFSASPRNLILFMPYLDWEKGRYRHNFARAMQEIRGDWEAERLEKKLKVKEERQRLRKDLHPESAITKARANFRAVVSNLPGLAHFPDVVERLYPSQVVLPKGCSRLGQLLLDAAALYETMSQFRDKELLKKYLYVDPPIHPRCTLDQAYYWTSKDRDRDQVIYRATNASPQDFRHLDHESEEWVDHSKEKSKDECKSCTKAFQKISQVVMVDQLWMWVLDGRTIITCFPERYGTQKHDRLGVHRSISTRLENAGPNQITSVFDLALIIIDECSNAFFDQAETANLQPRVIDKFSEIIGNIASKELTAFRHLFLGTRLARAFYRNPWSTDPNEIHVPLLDIGPEANLHQEIKGIVEELDIMVSIVRSHIKVLEEFITHVQHMLDPDGISSSRHIPKGFYPSRDPGQPIPPGEWSEDQQKHTYRFFMLNAEEIRMKMDRRIRELEQLRQRAQSVCDSVKELMVMKQQQAAVDQAGMSLTETQESVKQGRSIMLFTVVTIIFLPLTFTAGIFGMNAVEFGADGSLNIAKELAVMFPISILIIAVTLTFAFSLRIRALLWALWQKCKLLAVRTPFHQHWADMDEKTNKYGESAMKEADMIVRLRKVKRLRDTTEERRKRQRRQYEALINGVELRDGQVNGRQRVPSRTSEVAEQVNERDRLVWPWRRRPNTSKNGLDDSLELGAM